MQIILAVLIILIPTELKDALSPILSVWNVGQGQWVSLQTSDICIHFDVGGEKYPNNPLLKRCYQKLNVVFISHWDRDHYNFLGRYTAETARICLADAPDLPRKARWIRRPLPCPSKIRHQIATLVVNLYRGFRGKQSNRQSHVSIAADDILIPGDSLASDEKIWSNSSALQKVKILILGHHGSQTSTSAKLLARLPRLEMAIASARKRKYGHPHLKVLKRLSGKKISVLSTENWGHIHIYLP